MNLGLLKQWRLELEQFATTSRTTRNGTNFNTVYLSWSHLNLLLLKYVSVVFLGKDSFCIFFQKDVKWVINSILLREKIVPICLFHWCTHSFCKFRTFYTPLNLPLFKNSLGICKMILHAGTYKPLSTPQPRPIKNILKFLRHCEYIVRRLKSVISMSLENMALHDWKWKCSISWMNNTWADEMDSYSYLLLQNDLHCSKSI